MSFGVQILADHIAVSSAVRLTTFELTFPRFILAELNTHRMLSRNSASSRAIPTEKHIQRVMEHPFVPLTFNKRVKGMGVGEEFGPEDAENAAKQWAEATACAINYADSLNRLGLDKSRANRLLEPFMWHTAIVSATEWDNFFALRNHPAAQPEFQVLARMMFDEYESSTPTYINEGEWSLPLADDFPYDAGPDLIDWEFWKKISASRCARVSYDKHTDTETHDAAIERADRLLGGVPPHLSPFEHVARPFTRNEWCRSVQLAQKYREMCKENDWKYDPVYNDSFFFQANFRGWVQMRYEIPNQSRADFAIKAAHDHGFA